VKTFLPKNQYDKIDVESKKMIRDFCAVNKDGFFMPENINYISIPWHMNHCCDGNVGFDSKGNFITIKEVNEGDELFYDYGLLQSDPDFKLVCKCGSNNCRKIITGNDWENPQYAKKNYRYMVPELKAIIKNNRLKINDE